MNYILWISSVVVHVLWRVHGRRDPDNNEIFLFKPCKTEGFFSIFLECPLFLGVFYVISFYVIIIMNLLLVLAYMKSVMV